jgi:hypothetical protein
MWHGSKTYVGDSFDNKMIAIIAYLSHQMMVDNIPCIGDCDSTIFKDLSPTKRNTTSLEITE